MSLVFDNVAFRYSAESAFELADISFKVEPGEVVGLAGTTGSGKSTVLKLSCALETPINGSVFIDGMDTSKKSARATCFKKVGVAFQNPERQMVAATVYEDIAFGPKNFGCTSEEVDMRVKKAAAAMELDIDSIKDDSPFLLSGGIQRRVALAGVIAIQPTYLALDEPTCGLDPKNHDQLLDILLELSQNQHIGIVIASHDLEDLAQICSRILVLSNGQIKLEGRPTEVLGNSNALEKCGLDAPFTTSFANRLQQKKILDARETYRGVEDLASEIARAYEKRAEHAR